MKRKIVLIALFGLLFLAGCKTQQQAVVEVPVQYKEKIVEKLVPIQIPADSSSISALFECDSTNKVIMKQLSEEKTKRIQSQFNFENGLLKYKAFTLHDTVYIPGKETTIYKEVPIKVEVVKEVNKLTTWQRGQMHIGRLFLTLLMAYGVYRLLKWKFKLV